MNTAIFSRRNFVKALGLSSLALTLPGFKYSNLLRTKSQIGIQLYTVRRQIETDFEDVIKKIASIGYKGIETYPLPSNITIKQASEIFKKYNLKIFSMHTDLPDKNNFKSIVEMAKTYRSERVVYPGWPEGEKYKGLEGIKRTMELYNKINSDLRKEGLKFGLHNHWWEFEDHDGVIPFYYLLENLDKDIFFEIDTYWVKTAGMNPVKVLKDFGPRAPLLHIKDGPAKKGDEQYKMVPAGEGTLDFSSIIDNGGDNIEWLVIEFDEYDGDIFEGIKSSYTFIDKLL